MMIEMKNMSYAIPSVGNILTDISLTVAAKDIIGVLGRNGAGKTTLIDLIMGFRRPVNGTISVLGSDPAMSDRKIFKDISYLSQYVSLKENISVQTFFEFHRSFFSQYNSDDEARLMNIFDIDYRAKIGGLSTGQKRRIQIIAALASRPKILLIDEITAVLDPDARHLFFKLIKEVNELHSTTILLATNIIEDLKGRVDSLYFINDTKLEHHQASELENLFSGDLNE